MSRFDGYNRNDFHHPRTTREAFGSPFHVTEEPSKVKEVLAWVVYVICIGLTLLFLQG
jgi:hypothetical protein